MAVNSLSEQANYRAKSISMIEFVISKYCSAFRAVLFMCVAPYLAACSTVPPAQDISLSEMLASPLTTALDFETSERGLIVFELEIPNIGRSKFILDTGATTSAIYKQSLPADGQLGQAGEIVRVQGMNNSENLQTITLPNFKIGSSTVNNLNVAILVRPPHHGSLLRQVQGIIGLDVLSAYRVLIDPKKQKLYLIENHAVPIAFDRNWKSISITKTPFEQSVYGLHFLKLRVNGAPIYAMLDTGAEFNVMNWNFKHMWQLTARRRYLEKSWKHDGAMGEFKPEATASLAFIKSGSYNWPKQTFLVFDFNTFDSIGLEDKPLMIAGIPFLKDKTILLDFANDLMWLQTDSEKMITQ